MSNEGYYDDNGNFIGGYYDEDGNYVEGYYDEYGYYALAYYDEAGNYLGGGYYDDNGEYVEYVYEADDASETTAVSDSADRSRGYSFDDDEDDGLTYENLDGFAFLGDSGYGKRGGASRGASEKSSSAKSTGYSSERRQGERRQADRRSGEGSTSARKSGTLRTGSTEASTEYRREMRGGNRKGKKSKGAIIGSIVVKVVATLLVFLLITAGGVYAMIHTIVKGPSEEAKNIFVSTIQETGQMKFVNKLFFSEEEIVAITGQNSMGTIEEDVNTDLITVGGTSAESGDGSEAGNDFDINGFELIELTGRTYYAKMMIINDPSRVKLSTIYNGAWAEYGKCLDEFVEAGNYLAGVNGGEYQSDSNKGGQPKGIVVCDGQIQYNRPQAGDVLIGFNTDNILIIRDVGNLSAEQAKALVEELKIRDAVTFKDIADGDDNHFAKLIINGESIPLSGSGSGANPRTVIGQRADGTVLILVTDGRGASGHLGATAADLVSIMTEYGAVNAANMDGGSSSSMYYDGEYEMTSVTLYYANSSWRLPLAFVIERRD